MSTTLIIRDQYGIHPDDAEFVREKIKEIVERLRGFRFLEMSASDQACFIGQALNELQPKIFKGHWLNFLQDHFGEFRSQRTLYNWMLMAKFRPVLLKHPPKKLIEATKPILDATGSESKTYDSQSVTSTESRTYATPSNLPSIETSIKLIQGWLAKQRGKTRSTSKKRELREYCPTCGQFLSKRVKGRMKEHSAKRF
jgi:hypothetical protein